MIFHLQSQRTLWFSFHSLGDIERLKMQSTEGEAEKQALRERIDQLLRSQQELESRATSLQLTVDRLTLALAKTEEEEQAFKEKVIINTVRSNRMAVFYLERCSIDSF